MANWSDTLFQMAIGRIPQTNYLTATVPAANAFVEQLADAPVIFNVKPNSLSNKGQTTGRRFASERWNESWQSGDGYDFFLTSQNAGRYFHGALGSYAVAQVGVTAAYKHTFTPMDLLTSAQLPSYSVLPLLAPTASGINALFPSNVVESFSLSSEGQSRVKASVAWRGSGEEINPSGVTYATHVTGVQGTQNHFYNTQSKILVAADNNAGVGFTTCEMLKWNFGISNSFADGDFGCPRFITPSDPESGALRSHLLLTDTAFDLGYTLRLRESDPAYAALKAQTPTQIVTSLIGKLIGATVTKHQLDITTPLTHYEMAERGFENGFAVINIKPDPLYQVSSSSIVKVELYNDIVSYIV